MSTERTPFVTDEQIDDLAESFVDRKTTRAIESPMRIREEVLCGNFASELRDIYEAALASKDAEIEALRNPWISVKDYDQAISEEIKNVSHVQYDSHEICKHFASKVRSRLTAAATNNTNDNEAR